MTSVELFLAFLAATAVFAYVPGPAVLYTAAQTVAGGRRAGFLASLGIHIGGYAHVFLAAFGLAAFLEAVPTAYLVMKIAGAAYLVWLGVKMIRSPEGVGAIEIAAPRTGGRAFLDSVVVEALNPKVALFYVAFLPQFVDPSAAIAVWAQFVVLGVLVNVMFSSADVVTVILSDRIVARARRSNATVKWMQRGAGAVLCGLGLKLALQKS